MQLLIDTHAHIDAPELAGGRPELLADAARAGIGRLIVPGVRSADWQALLQLVRQQDALYAAPGLHPIYAEQWSEAAAEELHELTRQPKVVAVGEIGLDGAVGPALELQEHAMREQLQIALQANLPVLLHARKATGRLLEILREMEIGRRIGGVWHGFSGSLEVGQVLWRLGFKIGVGPILLRPSARKLPQAVVELPQEALLLETDLPDMAERPEALVAVAERVAELRGCPLEEVVSFTGENARDLFHF
ncbi:TatD family hydrolase [Malonomonas rubra]|uniref:TatD family hydrolase n=1 Tax=Malonomonas rubra TaxID=57040 RepID=UPI0026EFFC31|nr:TatD family hydrolase [Malonomonas rubra]